MDWKGQLSSWFTHLFFPASVFFKRKPREKQFDTCIGHLNVVIFHIQFNVFMHYLQLITSQESLLFKSDLLVSSFNTWSRLVRLTLSCVHNNTAAFATDYDFFRHLFSAGPPAGQWRQFPQTRVVWHLDILLPTIHFVLFLPITTKQHSEFHDLTSQWVLTR